MATVPPAQSVDDDHGQAAGENAAIAVFPNASHQRIGNLSAQAAGRDIHISTYNFTAQHTPPFLRPLSETMSQHGMSQGAESNQHLGLISHTAPRRFNISAILNLCHLVSNIVLCGSGDNETEGSIDVMPIESESAVDLPPSLLPTKQEIYVRSLLKTGLGLPCWQPKPLQDNMLPEGIVPGDVGTYTVDRSFRKLFNLWEDESAIRALAATCSAGPYQPLQGRTISEPMLQGGETLREGAHATSHLTTVSPTEPAVVHEFQCHALSGAVLALTSPAHLFVTDDKDAIQSYIVQHIEAIYRHASSIRRVGERESLYVITGCIKSESWAIAAYMEYMHPTNNILQLVRIPLSPQESPHFGFKHQWTKQGTSWARVNDIAVPELMNQALFLQGFKITFTPQFRSRVTESSQNPNTMTPGPTGGSDHGHDDGLFPDPDSHLEGEGGTGNGEGAGQRVGSSFGSWSLTLNSAGSTSKATVKDADERSVIDDEDLLTEFPRPPEIGYHPSDSINAQLLEKTQAEVAICHDDDWRPLFKSCMSNSTSVFTQSSMSEERRVCVKDGLVFLLPRGCDEARFTEQGTNKEQAETVVPELPETNEEPSKAVDAEEPAANEEPLETVEAQQLMPNEEPLETADTGQPGTKEELTGVADTEQQERNQDRAETVDAGQQGMSDELHTSFPGVRRAQAEIGKDRSRQILFGSYLPDDTLNPVPVPRTPIIPKTSELDLGRPALPSPTFSEIYGPFQDSTSAGAHSPETSGHKHKGGQQGTNEEQTKAVDVQQPEESGEDQLKTVDAGRQGMSRGLPAAFGGIAGLPDLTESDIEDLEEASSGYFDVYESAAGGRIMSSPEPERHGTSRESVESPDKGRLHGGPAGGRPLSDYNKSLRRTQAETGADQSRRTPSDIYHPDLFQANYEARARARQAALVPMASDRRDQSSTIHNAKDQYIPIPSSDIHSPAIGQGAIVITNRFNLERSSEYTGEPEVIHGSPVDTGRTHERVGHKYTGRHNNPFGRYEGTHNPGNPSVVASQKRAPSEGSEGNTRTEAIVHE